MTDQSDSNSIATIAHYLRDIAGSLEEIQHSLYRMAPHPDDEETGGVADSLNCIREQIKQHTFETLTP
jgi:hypothetical protein